MSDTKRQRTILIVTAIAFAVVSGLVTLAIVLLNDSADLSKRLHVAEQQVSELELDTKTANDRAKRARAQASDLIGFFTEGLRDEMAKIGRTDLLEAAARRGEAYFEALPPGDIDTHSDYSHARMLLLRGWAHHNQGALPESDVAFDRAIKLLEPHVEMEGVDRLLQYGFLQILNESTLSMRESRQLDRAETRLKRALSLGDELHEAAPDDEAWLHSRGLSLFGSVPSNLNVGTSTALSSCTTGASRASTVPARCIPTTSTTSPWR